MGFVFFLDQLQCWTIRNGDALALTSSHPMFPLGGRGAGVVRNPGSDDTGSHGDIGELELGGMQQKWEYDRPMETF